jgi:hypothetical protein
VQLLRRAVPNGVLAGQLAAGRYARQASGIRDGPRTTHAGERGATDGRRRLMPASSGVRSRFERLHGRHAATRFSHT